MASRMLMIDKSAKLVQSHKAGLVCKLSNRLLGNCRWGTLVLLTQRPESPTKSVMSFFGFLLCCKVK